MQVSAKEAQRLQQTTRSQEKDTAWFSVTASEGTNFVALGYLAVNCETIKPTTLWYFVTGALGN